MRTFVVVLLAFVTLSGCASEPTEDAPRIDEAIPILEDALAALENGNDSANLELLGSHSNSGEEADAWGDYIFVDRGNNVHILHRGFEDGNITFSETAVYEGVGVKDVKVSNDGQWMFLGNDDQASMAPLGGAARQGGFYVVDIADKAAPALSSYLPVGPTRGPHMVFYHQRTDGTELVFGANGDISINRFHRDTGTLTEASRYMAPQTEVVRTVDTIDVLYQVYAHDMFVMEDAGANGTDAPSTLMYVANWDAGLRIVDVSDPDAPVEVGGWNEYPEGHSGNLHTVATEWINGTRITVGSVEVGFDVVGGKPYALDEEKSIVYIWDTTDPSDIQLLGTWENPLGINPGQAGLVAPAVTNDKVYSSHNLQLEEGILYLAHYNLGIFVLDVRTPEMQAAPGLLGYTNPGDTWDVIISGGAVMGNGGYGLAAFGFPLLELGPEGLTSRA